MKKNTTKKILYIDAEWFISQKMYLLGYAWNLREFGQLYGRALTADNVAKLFAKADYIAFWGPDIGMLEKCFNLKLREQHCCINLLTVARTLHPRAKSHKLAHWEKLAGAKRTTIEYKTNIWKLSIDWKNNRERCLTYNREDVINMVRVQRYIFERFKVGWNDMENFRLT